MWNYIVKSKAVNYVRFDYCSHSVVDKYKRKYVIYELFHIIDKKKVNIDEYKHFRVYNSGLLWKQN